MYRRDREQLEKFIKKPYHGIGSFLGEIMDLYNEVEILQLKVNVLETDNEILKSQLNTPSNKLANAIEEYINESCVRHWEVPGIVEEEVKNHLSVNVETNGYYEEYSGQHDHWHESKADIYWK